VASVGSLERLLDRQGRDLERLTDEEAAAVLAIYDQARRELAERLDAVLASRDGEVSFTAFDIGRTQVLIEDAVRQLQVRLGQQVDGSVQSVRTRAGEHLLALMERAEPEWEMVGGSIRLDVLTRLARPDGTLLHRYSVARYGADVVSRMQGELVQAVAQRLTYTQTRERLVAREFSASAAMRPRAELIVRNEMSNAYNGSYTAEVGNLAKQLDAPGDPDPLLLRISEHLEVPRSHPISWLLDGKTRAPDGPPFRVSVAAVRAKAAELKLKRRGGGVLWRVEGASYVGETLPAHHWERGRVHAWRESWADL